jgi:hypothetical protein
MGRDCSALWRAGSVRSALRATVMQRLSR